MMAADRQIRPDDVHIKNEIKRLTEHDTRDRMKAYFDKKVEDSEWNQHITSALDKAMDCPYEKPKSYDELLLEIGGTDPSKIDLANTEEVLQKIAAGLLDSEHLKEMKKDIFREWDKLRADTK